MYLKSTTNISNIEGAFVERLNKPGKQGGFMADWVMTATTIYCEAVEDEVTLMVNRDGSAQCTGKNKYAEPTTDTARMMKTKCRELSKTLRCDGLKCDWIARYWQKLMAEEDNAAAGGENNE